MVPEVRIRAVNEAAAREAGDYVLYWMIAARRTRWNYAMDRAAEWATELGKPILVFEALRTGYRWASDRIHRFVIDGMADNAAALDGSGIGYYPYLEPEDGAGKGLLAALAERAAVVVTDEFPSFFLPRMVEAAGRALDVRLEAVDSNGLMPLAAPGKAFARAYDFRRHLQKELPPHLEDFPRRSIQEGAELPSFGEVPASVLERWPAADDELLAGDRDLSSFPIDHSVPPVPFAGGYRAARRRLRDFVDHHLDDYGERNHPDADSASGFSPYLHFGHLSSHQVVDAIGRREEWTPFQLNDPVNGARHGWWNLPEALESFLDELVTWRELGYGFCHYRDDYADYDTLPDWARETLDEHRDDERPELYDLEAFEAADTHDELWNAAQRQLLAEGRIHNYLRMLWGKKILHWTASPESALDIMIELNNKYAIDGRNPNSYSGIFWVLGRFDRAWGPEREIFGKVRYMTSDSTRRKLRLDDYLERWGSQLSL